MRRFGLRRNTSAILLLIFLLCITHVAAQGLPALPGSNDGGSNKNDDSKNDDSNDKNTDTVTTGTTTAAAKTTDTAKATTTLGAAASSSAEQDAPGLTGLPTLAGQQHAAPSVPPTANAPFMHKSNLPEGTVFICVGAALGFFAFMVLVWRGFLAWSVHRSVKRAANAHIAKYDGKDPLAGLKKSGPYMSPGPGSTMSLDHLGATGKKGGSKANSAHTSLFFSPTAGAGMQSNPNRGSGYLPAGYYASGNAAAGGGTGMAHIGGGGIPMANIGNTDKRYSRVNSSGNSRRNSRGPSPPHSPSLPPSRAGADSVYNGSRVSTQGLIGQPSNNSLSSLSVAPQGRAPSAYLEDLFESHAPAKPSHDDGRGNRRH